MTGTKKRGGAVRWGQPPCRYRGPPPKLFFAFQGPGVAFWTSSGQFGFLF